MEDSGAEGWGMYHLIQKMA